MEILNPMFFLLFLPTFFAADVFYNLTYTRQIIAPDGFAKSMVLVNGLFPGPPLRAKVGDTMHITVTNFLDPSGIEKLSIHWHGLHQSFSPYYDGTGGVTQCPIPYGTSFTYVFTVDAAGSYWYHPHEGQGTRTEGGFGFLIIDDVTPLADFDEEIQIILSEQYHISAALKSSDAISIPSETNAAISVPVPGDSILINGKGLQEVNIPVQPGKVYLLRILSASALSYFNFAIADHNLTLVNWGETRTQPVVFQSLDLSSGQRADCLISTVGKPNRKYLISVQPNFDANSLGANFNGVSFFQTGYIQYGNAQVVSSTRPVNETKAWNAQIDVLRPLIPRAAKTPNITILIDEILTPFNDPETLRTTTPPAPGVIGWALTGQMYRLTETPLLHLEYFGDASSLPAYSKPIDIPINATVRIIFQNRVSIVGSALTHPWHIHGHSFQLIGYGPGLYNSTTDDKNFNLKDPFVTDTINSYCVGLYCEIYNQQAPTSPVNVRQPAGWTAVQFDTYHPGVWLMHCHIEWHAYNGMLIAFNVNSKSLPTKQPLPKDTLKCGLYGDRLKVSPAVDAGVPTSSPTKALPNFGSSSSPQLSDGAVAGIVIGTVAGAALILGVAVHLLQSPPKGDLNRELVDDSVPRSNAA